eukprot:m.36470 g.36470  ORF g.36470 m.36470 type:complete len:89 (+) comp10094_c0_seq1:923-1189(+)
MLCVVHVQTKLLLVLQCVLIQVFVLKMDKWQTTTWPVSILFTCTVPFSLIPARPMTSFLTSSSTNSTNTMAVEVAVGQTFAVADLQLN